MGEEKRYVFLKSPKNDFRNYFIDENENPNKKDFVLLGPGNSRLMESGEIIDGFEETQKEETSKVAKAKKIIKKKDKGQQLQKGTKNYHVKIKMK